MFLSYKVNMVDGKNNTIHIAIVALPAFIHNTALPVNNHLVFLL